MAAPWLPVAARGRPLPELSPETGNLPRLQNSPGVHSASEPPAAPMVVWVARGFVPILNGKVGEHRFRFYVVGLTLAAIGSVLLVVADGFFKLELWFCGALLGALSLLSMPALLDDMVLPPIRFELSACGLQVSSVHGFCLCARRARQFAATDVLSISVYKQRKHFKYVHVHTSAVSATPVRITRPEQVLGEMPGWFLPLGKCSGTLKSATCAFLGARIAGEDAVVPLSQRVWLHTQLPELFDLADAVNRWMQGPHAELGRPITEA